MKPHLTKIICSADLSEAYCLNKSERYKREFKGKRNYRVIYIPCSYLNSLIHESFEGNKFKWNMEKILEYGKIR